jgi:CheY-like chemotaxis protein
MNSSIQNLFELPQQSTVIQRTLLQVEDNPANIGLMELLIARRSDLKLLTAIDGVQGVEMARQNMPDVILMDINMPGMSGMSALKILRENSVTANIPVIAVSSNAFPLQVSEGLQAGFVRYLTKPYEIAELMEAIDNTLLVSTPASPSVSPDVSADTPA